MVSFYAFRLHQPQQQEGGGHDCREWSGRGCRDFHKAQCLKGLRTAVNQIPDKKQFCILRELRKQFFKTFKAPLKVADGE